MQDVLLENAVLCWHPAGLSSSVSFAIRRLGDPYNDEGPHLCTAGAVYASWQQADTDRRLRMLFGEVMSIMARDGVPFDLIHSELLKIPEYRTDILAPDVVGADDGEDL